MYNLLERVSPFGMDGSGLEGSGEAIMTKLKRIMVSGAWEIRVFFEISCLSQSAPNPQNFVTVACTVNVLLILAQTIHIVLLMTYFYVQAL